LAVIVLVVLTASTSPAAAQQADAPQAVPGGQNMVPSEQDVMAAIGQVQAKVGAGHKARIETGVRQVARLWMPADGDAAEFVKFCTGNFVVGPALDALFERWQRKSEAIAGAYNSLSVELRLEMDEDRGALQPIDMLFAQWNPAAHLLDDLFSSKLAFVALLNFPAPALEEMLAKSGKWSRRDWAEARAAQGVSHRVPAQVLQKVTEAYTAAENYIANYNICMDHVVGPDGKPMFREGLKLISHWGLRDELKALYSDRANLPKQEMIQTIMDRIIHQQIPVGAIDQCKVFWDPRANTLDGKPVEREPDTRFAHLLRVFHAEQLQDPFYPDAPSHIDRRFRLMREMPETEVEALLASVLKAPEGKRIAGLIEKRLGRKLQPFDIWYDGFKARGSMDERKLDEAVAKRYPSVEAFQAAIPDILGKLGFDPATAQFLGGLIEVDPARGAGHAWGPKMRGEKAHLRTRVPPGGMDYKGFNIAMHELGHNVEQVFTLNRVDHTLLEGVPNTAFTEGFAFVFQARDLDVLGLSRPDPKQAASEIVDDFWMTREIAGVGLVDMRVWRWLYAHPEASPAELRAAVVQSAKDVWNEFFAEAFGVKDSPILAIYSHMIAYGLYLPDYPLGHIIAFQVEDYFKTHPLGQDMERMCKQGRITPNAWMQGAVGQPISSQPLIRAAAKALEVVR
jgi:hypothetical protein